LNLDAGFSFFPKGGTPMAFYTFTFRLDDRPAVALAVDWPSDPIATDRARKALLRMIGRQDLIIGRARVTVGRGLRTGDVIRWIGSWQWSGQQGWSWADIGEAHARVG
jgi:hypothetical protein